MRILILGATGLLGSALCTQRRHGIDILGLSRSECDVTDADEVSQALATTAPDAVVNAAALAGNNACDANPQQAWLVNTIGAYHCATAAHRARALYVQISGNTVFRPTGTPRQETERPDQPFSVLSAAKAGAEHLVAKVAPRHLIVRTALLFGDRPDGTPAGLVGHILRQAEAGAPLTMDATSRTNVAYAPDVAAATIDLVLQKATGAVHLVNEGLFTPAEIADWVVALADGHADITTMRGASGDRILDSSHAYARGIRLRPATEALRHYVRTRSAARA